MMGQAIETGAVAECIRATLDLFLHDHPELEHGDVEVADIVNGEGDNGEPTTFDITIIGFSFEITVRGPGR